MKSNQSVEQVKLIPQPIEVAYGSGCLDIQSVCCIPTEDDVIVKRAASLIHSDENGVKVEFRQVSGLEEKWKKYADQPEGYAISVEEQSISIHASSSAGFLYGAITCKQLLQQYGERLPCMQIGDYPRISHRSVQLSFAQQNVHYRADYAKHFVQQMANIKINAIYLYIETYFKFPSFPHLGGPGAMCPEDVRELTELCKSYNIALIPSINVLGHCSDLLALQKYSHLAEYDPEKDDIRTYSGFSLCSSNPDVELFINQILDDILDCFDSEIIHVGGDEVSPLGKCPICKEAFQDQERGPLAFYSNYFLRIKQRLNERDRVMGIWGDMLAQYCVTEKTDGADQLLEQLKEGTIIYDWSYDGGSKGTIEYFSNAGFKVVASTSTNGCYSSSVWLDQQENQRLLFKEAGEHQLFGGLVTDWINYLGYHAEHMGPNYASGAVMLWQGTDDKFAVGMSSQQFEVAYVLQRYGLRSDSLQQYWHWAGDDQSPLLALFGNPKNGSYLRKCMYYTDNPLHFWTTYAYLLREGNFTKYAEAVSVLRDLWEKVEKELEGSADPYWQVFKGPLVMHENLIARFEMAENAYRLYDQSAHLQYEDETQFKLLVDEAAAIVDNHANDYEEAKQFITQLHEQLGIDSGGLLRLEALQRNVKYLSEAISHMKNGGRGLPSFRMLHDGLFQEPQTDYWFPRIHEWVEESPQFRKYGVGAHYEWEGIPR